MFPNLAVLKGTRSGAMLPQGIGVRKRCRYFSIRAAGHSDPIGGATGKSVAAFARPQDKEMGVARYDGSNPGVGISVIDEIRDVGREVIAPGRAVSAHTGLIRLHSDSGLHLRGIDRNDIGARPTGKGKAKRQEPAHSIHYPSPKVYQFTSGVLRQDPEETQT